MLTCILSVSCNLEGLTDGDTLIAVSVTRFGVLDLSFLGVLDFPTLDFLDETFIIAKFN